MPFLSGLVLPKTENGAASVAGACQMDSVLGSAGAGVDGDDCGIGFKVLTELWCTHGQGLEHREIEHRFEGSSG